MVANEMLKLGDLYTNREIWVAINLVCVWLQLGQSGICKTGWNQALLQLKCDASVINAPCVHLRC
jgi:hypothetical protein